MGAISQPSTRPSWTIRSTSGRTKLLSGALGILGFLILWSTIRVPLTPDKEVSLIAAFWLGLLLVGVTCWVFLFLEDVVVLVDETQRQLRVSRKSPMGTRSSIHDFNSIRAIEVTSAGQSHRGIVTHHLNIALKDGRRLKTQFWSVQYSETLELAERLAHATGTVCEPKRRFNPIDLKMLLISGTGAILVYCVWYKFSVGSFCLAMWHGTAPAVIMGVSFFAIFRLCRQIPRL